MHKVFPAILTAMILVSPACPASAANVGPAADVQAIRKMFPAKSGPCTQRVDHVAVRGSYALATLLQSGGCDSAVVVVLQKRGTWHSLGALGGVPDACCVHSKGVPLNIAGGLVAAFTGSSNPSLTSTRACGG